MYSADLRDARLNGATMSHAQCEGSDFTGADLSDAQLESADFNQTTMTAVVMNSAKTERVLANGVTNPPKALRSDR
jgi:uncharacterized protein YjbI with pentapeptide repeats